MDIFPPAAIRTALPPNWSEYKAEDGTPYYHNHTTGVTQWEIPIELPSGAESPQVRARDAISAPSTAAELSPEGGSSLTLTKKVLDALTNALVPGTGQIGGDMELGLSGKITAKEAPTADVKLFYCISLTKARRYCDVSTVDVIQRMVFALAPFVPNRKESAQRIIQRPDLYGPFWIVQTSHFLLFITSNIADFVQNKLSVAHFYVCLVAQTFVLSAWLLTATLAYLSAVIMRHQVEDTAEMFTFVQYLSFVGYALSPVGFLAICSMTPAPWLRWIIAVIGLVAAISFVYIIFSADNSFQPFGSYRMTTVVSCGVVAAALGLVYLSIPPLFYSWAPSFADR